jgi:type IV pilus assembly protein PilW
MFHALTNKRGFTLIELLLAMGLSAVVMSSVGAIYYQQQKSFLVQEQIAGAQQNLRAALYFIEREIRMAGCDPTQKADVGIVNPGPNTINFTLDITNTAGTGNPDGVSDGPNEDVTYSLGDGDGDGDNDLFRNAGLLAENIDALNFVYLNEAGNPTATISLIRSVQVTIVAKTGREDPRYTDTRTYRNQQGQTILGAQNDHFRRKHLSANIACRNLWE